MTRNEFIEKVRFYTSDDFLNIEMEAAREFGTINSPDFVAKAIAFNLIRDALLEMKI